MSNRHSVSKSDWSGKTAVVVGASTGLGRTLADALAAQGAAHVVLAARDIVKLQAAERQLAEEWPVTRFSMCAVDVTEASGAAALAEHVATIGLKPGSGDATQIDLLINATGLSDRGPALKLTSERLDELMHANVHGPLLVIQSLVSHLSRGGVIVNIGSLSSHFAPRYLGGYSLANHALRALTQQLRLELKESGIHVMLVCPGPIARSDVGSPRYAHLPTAGDVPPEALGGGGGAKLRGLDPGKLSAEILQAAAARRAELIRPRKARLLIWLMALWPAQGEAWLRHMTR